MWLILIVTVFFLQGSDGQQRPPPGRYQLPRDPGDDISARIVVIVPPTSTTSSTTTTASPLTEATTPRPTNGSDPEQRGDEEIILPGRKKLTYLLFKQIFYLDLKQKYEFKFVLFKWWFLIIFVKIKND